MGERKPVDDTSRENVECRLVRPDGSCWRVEELTFTRHGLKVRAERIAVRGTGRDRLDGVYLQAGDRLEWRDADGEVVWSHHNPVDGG